MLSDRRSSVSPLWLCHGFVTLRQVKAKICWKRPSCMLDLSRIPSNPCRIHERLAFDCFDKAEKRLEQLFCRQTFPHFKRMFITLSTAQMRLLDLFTIGLEKTSVLKRVCSACRDPVETHAVAFRAAIPVSPSIRCKTRGPDAPDRGVYMNLQGDSDRSISVFPGRDKPCPSERL